MEFSEYLSTTMPKAKISRKQITIDTSISEIFDLKIENIRGGYLTGIIKKYDDFIELSTELINKNLVDLQISVNKELIESGKKYQSIIRIFTNGGDFEILVEIINEQNCFKVSENIKLYTIKDIYTYSRKNMEEFSILFVKEEFISWLGSLGNHIIEIYNFVKEDPNIYRRIDNFFILLGLKNHSEIIYPEKIELEILPYQENYIEDYFILKKSEHGFVDIDLVFSEKHDFISLDKYRIKNSDFLNNDEIKVNYTIDVSKLKKKKEFVYILLDNDINKKIEICINKIVNINCTIDKNIYKDNETGYISVENHLGTPITFNMSSESKNIKISEESGKIDKDGNLKFEISLTSFNKGIVKFFKQPYFDAEITILFRTNDLKVRKEFNITIATDNLEFE